MNRCVCLLLIVLTLTPKFLEAQDFKKITVEEILALAIEHNYKIKEQRLYHSNSIQTKKEALCPGLPQINGYVDYKNYLIKPKIILPGSLTGSSAAPDIVTSFSKTHNLDYGVEASQLLFSLEYIYGVKTATKANEIAELGVELTELDVIHQIYSEYYNLLAIYKNLEIIRSNILSLEQVRKKTDALQNADLVLKTDLDRIDINISNLKTQERQVSNAIDIQTNNLMLISGINENITWKVDTTGFTKIFSTIVPKSTAPKSVDFSRRIELQILGKQIELNDFQIKSAKGSMLPTLAAYATYFDQYQKDDFSPFQNNSKWFDAGVVGLKMNIPIFSGNKSRIKIAKAKITKEISLTKRKQLLQMFSVDHMNSLNMYTVNLDNCINQKKSIRLAQNVRNQEEFKYKEGLSTLTDLLISEQDLRNAEINYIKNLLQLRISELNLLRSEGKLYQLKSN